MEYLNAAELNDKEINEKIRELLSEDSRELTIQNIHSMHNVGAGLSGSYSLCIEDSTGLYTGSYMEGPTIVVEGNAGWYAGDDMMSGTLIIKKNTGCNVGAYICGGDIVIYGSTGSRVGYGMKGGNIIVGGDAGRWAGQMATGGTLIICGRVGRQIGESMYNGVIYVQDSEVEDKLGGNVFLDSITEEEAEKLNTLFAAYQIEETAVGFQAIRPSLSGRHTYHMFQPCLTPKDAAKYRNGKMGD